MLYRSMSIFLELLFLTKRPFIQDQHILHLQAICYFCPMLQFNIPSSCANTTVCTDMLYIDHQTKTVFTNFNLPGSVEFLA